MKLTKYRALRFGVTSAALRAGHAGVSYLEAQQALTPYPERITDRLQQWAQTRPEQTFMARRSRLPEGGTGDWIHLRYGQAWERARSIAQALLERGLSAERPVLILSGNDLEHAQMALGCLIAGVPFVPTSPAYSLVSQDFQKLRHVVQTVTPGLIFAEDGERYGAAIQAVRDTLNDAALEVVVTRNPAAGAPCKLFGAWATAAASPAVDAAMAATGPDTITKFLFTSGSTKLPKAVINTQRMWCANQQQMAQSMPVLTEQPLVLVDWLPWNHTFGGNHNFGMVLYHGGTLYIDDGKPTPALQEETFRNLREIAPTVYFNVPTGFDAIARAMRTDSALRDRLLSRVRMFFYAGASLWDSLFQTAEEAVGERIVMTTGLGMTESGPFALFVTNPNVQAGDLGVPCPELSLKLVPNQGKTELRYKGPNITPGYWRAPEETAAHFDEEGYFCSGDAVQWIDSSDPSQGLKFDGRIAEDFKLATGTFVSVGPLRARVIAAGAPYLQDVVLTGLDRTEVGALVFPAVAAVRALSGLSPTAALAEVLASPPVVAAFQKVLNELAATATGSANRIARLCVLSEPPTIDGGEITDKGSINQRAVLALRKATVEALYADTLPGLLKPLV